METLESPTYRMEHVPALSARELAWNALEGGKNDWRSLESLSKETGLTVSQIEQLMEGPLADRVLKAWDDDSGKDLFISKSRYKRIAPLWSKLLSLIANEVR